MTLQQIATFHKTLAEVQKTVEAEADIYTEDGATDLLREQLYDLMIQALKILQNQQK